MKPHQKKVLGLGIVFSSACLMALAPWLVFALPAIHNTFIDSGWALTPYGCFFDLEIDETMGVRWLGVLLAVGVAGLFSGIGLCTRARFRKTFA
jgi:hypothetical protein